eukprot:UN22026
MNLRPEMLLSTDFRQSWCFAKKVVCPLCRFMSVFLPPKSGKMSVTNLALSVTNSDVDNGNLLKKKIL